VVLGAGAHIRCDGKGRKERCTPLRRDTVKGHESVETTQTVFDAGTLLH
jgi:hypothetical protein